MNFLENFLVYYSLGLFICVFLDLITKSKFQKSEFIIALLWPALPIMFYMAKRRLAGKKRGVTHE